VRVVRVLPQGETGQREHRLRYAPDGVWDQAGLLERLGVNDADAVGDVLDGPWDVELDRDSADLRVGTSGTGLGYPFRLQELVDPAAGWRWSWSPPMRTSSMRSSTA
jgi:hypothetical protein